MRLDKFLCQLNMGSRSEVKTLIRKGQVTVNGIPATASEQKIDENSDNIVCKGISLTYKAHAYYMMNKPRGVVSATKDSVDKTVLDLLLPAVSECDRKRELVPCGRLDKDTEGLLLLTDDGGLVHELLSPKKHVDKTYLVTMAKELSSEEITLLEQGVDIGEKTLTRPAKVETISDKQILLTIHEGKFHQVKRMLQAVGNEVTALKRISFGPLLLDDKLSPGECRALTEEEIHALAQCTQGLTKDLADNEAIPSNPPSLDGVNAAIFDLDGTLVDSMWIWRQIDIEYLARFGMKLPETLQSEIEGMSFKETAVYFKNRFQISDSIEQIMKNWNEMAWEKYANEVQLKPGVKEFLKLCKSRGIKLGIATSNSRELAENVLKVQGVYPLFDCIMTGSDVQKGKPAPDIYLAAAEKLAVNPAACLVFEDIKFGIMAGQNAGMRVCAVEDAYSVKQRVEKRALAEFYINDYMEIVEGAQ